MMLRAFALGLACVSWGCHTHTETAVQVTAQKAAYPISLSNYLVADERVVGSEELAVLAPLRHRVDCVKHDGATDVSAAINEQVEKAGGSGVIAFTAAVSATPECQTITFGGSIVKLRAAQ